MDRSQFALLFRGLLFLFFTFFVLTSLKSSSQNARKSLGVVDSILKQTALPPPSHNENASLRFEIVVTLFRGTSEDGNFLLSPELQDIPVTIGSPDELIDPVVFEGVKNVTPFRPEAEGAYGHIVNSNRTGTVTFLPIVNGKDAGEGPGYLTYILLNYDVLPDVVIFLHSKPNVHGDHVIDSIRYVIDHQWTPQQIGFLHLNDYIVCRPGRGEENEQEAWTKFWEIAGFDPLYMPPFVKMPCCAQFMVTRERILLRPKWFYQQLLKLAYETNRGSFHEHYWHIFFGESAILSDDREVYNYILSNWTKPVQDAVLHNPYPNVPSSESMKPWWEQSIADPASYYPKLSSNRSVTCPPHADE